MCYGDIGHGKDGYYEEMMRQEAEQQAEREQYKQQQPTPSPKE